MFQQPQTQLVRPCPRISLSRIKHMYSQIPSSSSMALPSPARQPGPAAPLKSRVSSSGMSWVTSRHAHPYSPACSTTRPAHCASPPASIPPTPSSGPSTSLILPPTPPSAETVPCRPSSPTAVCPSHVPMAQRYSYLTTRLLARRTVPPAADRAFSTTSTAPTPPPVP